MLSPEEFHVQPTHHAPGRYSSREYSEPYERRAPTIRSRYYRQAPHEEPVFPHEEESRFLEHARSSGLVYEHREATPYSQEQHVLHHPRGSITWERGQTGTFSWTEGPHHSAAQTLHRVARELDARGAW